MPDTEKHHNYKWLHDEIRPDLVQLHNIKQVLYSGQTEFQTVDIIDTSCFGLCLVLDSKIQSSQGDEFIYHEALVQPAMIAHPQAESVFIAGGGEGATLREALNHKPVKKAVMVDIDKEVVDICRRYLAVMHQDSFTDPRAEIIHTDARKYLKETASRFDIAIIDLVEPLEGGPACLLYTREFYELVRNCLKPGGIVTVQSGAAGMINSKYFAMIVNTLKSVFPVVRPYQVYVPSFVELWGFATASMTLDPAILPPLEIDKRITGRLSRELKSYDGISHQALFTLSKHLRHDLSAADRVLTDADPLLI
jgi:spermidine synthase